MDEIINDLKDKYRMEEVADYQGNNKQI
jgi:hypothetical protein